MTVPVVWIAPAENAPEAAKAEAALRAWAQERGILIARARDDEPPAIAAPLDGYRAIEDELTRAREAIAAADVIGAERALSRAERGVLDHPELHQAAWLYAEVLRGWAAKWARVEPTDPERARAYAQYASAVDGGRASGIGESASAAPPPTRTYRLVGVDQGEENQEVYVDGLRVAAPQLALTRGLHHVHVQTRGRLAYAAWRDFGEESAVNVALPEPAACTKQDVSRGKGARCPAWLVVSVEKTALAVTSCSPIECKTNQVPWVIAERPSKEQGGVAPWVWVLIGAGVISGTGVALAAFGAFDQPAPPEQRFTNGGVRVSSFR